MKKTVWTFGLISGALVSALLAATIPFQGENGFDHSLTVGYAIDSTVVRAHLFWSALIPRQCRQGHSQLSPRAEGASEAALAQKKVELDKFEKMYQNPAFNAAVTILEPLPVAMVIALVSAGVLSRRKSADLDLRIG